jgi:hypothetical protein
MSAFLDTLKHVNNCFHNGGGKDKSTRRIKLDIHLSIHLSFLSSLRSHGCQKKSLINVVYRDLITHFFAFEIFILSLSLQRLFPLATSHCILKQKTFFDHHHVGSFFLPESCRYPRITLTIPWMNLRTPRTSRELLSLLTFLSR